MLLVAVKIYLFILSLIHSLNKYLLNASSIPGIMLGARDTALNEISIPYLKGDLDKIFN